MAPPLGTFGGKLPRKHAAWWTPTNGSPQLSESTLQLQPRCCWMALNDGLLLLAILCSFHRWFISIALQNTVGCGQWDGNGITCWLLNGTMAWMLKASNGFRSCSEVDGQCQTFDNWIMPHLSSLVLGQKLLETSHSSKPIIEIQPRRTGTVFSNGADNLTSWLPAFILSVFARDQLSCRTGNLS